MLDDLRFAARLLLKSPGYTAIIVLTLAVGIGGTVAIFSAVYAVLLAPLPYPDANAIVVPVSTNAARGFDRASVPYADYADWREQTDIFASVGLWVPVSLDVASGTGRPEHLDGSRVTDGYFGSLAAQPLVGRTLVASDHEPSAAPVVVISHGLWQRMFGGVPDVLGRDLRVAGTPAKVVGVLRANAVWPERSQFWVPLKPSRFNDDVRTRRDNMIFEAIARLRNDVTLETARARVAVLAERVAADHPESRKGWSSNLRPLRDYVVEREMRDALVVLLTAVAAVLLIVCVNIANLLLARGTVRTRELAVRTALGASRARLTRQLLTESALLAVTGGACGVALAWWLIRLLVRLAPEGVPFVVTAGLNAPALAAAAALTLSSVVLFGILPALAGSGHAPVSALKDGASGSGGDVRGLRLRDALAAAEMALAVILMVSAGLLLHSFERLVNRSPGVDVDHVVAAELSLPGARYPKRDDAARFYERLTRELAAVPGVTAAAATSALPVGGPGFGLGRVFLKEGQPPPPAGADYQANWNVVTTGYFHALSIPLQRGRVFSDADRETSTPVIVINETLARRMFPGEDPIGRRIRSWRDENVLREIVGVVADVRYSGLADADRGLVYVPHSQDSWGQMVVAVRTAGSPAAFAASLREGVARLDPELGLGKIGTMAEYARNSIARERFSAQLLAAFAGVAALLAAIGVYGVMAYAVARRSRELGVRAALGASPRSLFALVVGRGFALAAIGGGLGFAGALVTARLLSRLLFGIPPADPATLAAVGILLPTITMAACIVPARRAARVDPMRSLRAD